MNIEQGLRIENENLKRLLEETERERDEALAQNERLRGALNMQMTISGGEESGDSVCDRSMAVLNEQPPAALAALKDAHFNDFCDCNVTAAKMRMATGKGLKITGFLTDDGKCCIGGKVRYLEAFKAELQAEAFDSPVIETTMKAGCIGEFSFTVRGAGVCPICYEDGFNRDCETCDGNGVVDLSIEVPWDIQKAIFKSMCKYKAASIRQRAQEAARSCTYPDCRCPLELPHKDSPCAIGRNKESGNGS